MTQQLSCSASLNVNPYIIYIQSGILQNIESLVKLFSSLGSRFAIITDDKIASLHGSQLQKKLSEKGLEIFMFTFPSGEEHKTRATKEQLEDQLFAQGLGRDTCLIVLGGGVATDLGGYLAATYCRGLPLVMIPTSLLGMADACIGGKTGVNTPFGKNLIGCTYQPNQVLIDPSTLQSLPLNELRNGFVEMIKHGLIADSSYFSFLETHAEKLLALDPQFIEKAIFDSCQIKINIVEQDPHEKGRRRLLNCGHTVGHALEKLTDFELSHGEAVAIGMLVESHLAVQLDLLDQRSFEKIHSILVRYGLPLLLPRDFSFQEMIDAMSLDKKSLKGKPRFVMIDKIGTALSFDSDYCTSVDESILKKAIDWMNHDLCCH